MSSRLDPLLYDDSTAAELRDALVDELLAERTITSLAVERAFRTVPRHLFVAEGTPLTDVYEVDRSVVDVCIACCDGLKGLPEAIEEVWPQATVQQCVVHLVWSSLRYASKTHWSRITKDLRDIYSAPTEAAAETRFAEFENEWGDRYPAIIRLWRDALPTFTPFLTFPPEIRTIVYTTNAIESLNARFRLAARRRGHFPTEQAALKVLYLVIRNPIKGRANVTGETRGWKHALNALTLYYGDRITLN